MSMATTFTPAQPTRRVTMPKLKKSKSYGLRAELVALVADMAHDARTNELIQMAAILTIVKDRPELRKEMVRYAKENREELRTG